jgi:hypothetical protein
MSPSLSKNTKIRHFPIIGEIIFLISKTLFNNTYRYIIHSLSPILIRRKMMPHPRRKTSSASSILFLQFFLCYLAILLFLPHGTNSARFCYSGQNSRYAQKHCSSGSLGQLLYQYIWQ